MADVASRRNTVHRRRILITDKRDVADRATVELSSEAFSAFGYAIMLDDLFTQHFMPIVKTIA